MLTPVTTKVVVIVNSVMWLLLFCSSPLIWCLLLILSFRDFAPYAAYIFLSPRPNHVNNNNNNNNNHEILITFHCYKPVTFHCYPYHTLRCRPAHCRHVESCFLLSMLLSLVIKLIVTLCFLSFCLGIAFISVRFYCCCRLVTPVLFL